MKHLDERISDLVDDRLDHDERDRALVHLTICASCRDAVELERHAKNALRSLPDAEPSEALVHKLLALAEPGEPLTPDPPERASAPAPVANWRPRDSRPPSGPSSGSRPGAERRSRRRTRAMRLAAVGMCSTGAMLVLLASLGGTSGPSEPPATPASVVPPVDEFTVEHARSTGGLPFVQPGSLLVGQASDGSGDGW